METAEPYINEKVSLLNLCESTYIYLNFSNPRVGTHFNLLDTLETKLINSVEDMNLEESASVLDKLSEKQIGGNILISRLSRKVQDHVEELEVNSSVD